MNRFRTRYLAYALVVLATLAVANPAIAADDTPPAERGNKPLMWPTSGRMTQHYGCTGFVMEPRYGSCRHFHGGIDLANSRGTPIRAAADGIITHAGWDPWGTRNWMVMIRHGGGLTTWYAHMRGKNIPSIRKGVRVRQGEVIGYMDKTGMATGVHLHWAVLKDGRYVNPRNYVDGQPQRPPRKSGDGTGTLQCEASTVAFASGGATAVVLESDGSGGGRDSCVA